MKVPADSQQNPEPAVESMPDLVYVVDRKLRLQLVNREFVEWCRKRAIPVPMPGQNIVEVWNFLDPQATGEYQQVFDTGLTHLSERTVMVAGRATTIESRKIPATSEDQVDQVVTVIRDITEHRRVAGALKESEERCRRITDNMIDVVCQVDEQYRLSYVSPSVRHILGYNPKDIVGKQLSEIIHPDDRDRAMSVFAKNAQAGTISRAEFRARNANGQHLWVETIGRPLFDKEWRVSGMILATRDISGRKQAEEELHRLNSELEKRIAERTAELSAANERLKQEVLERRRAEREHDEALKRQDAILKVMPVILYSAELGNPLGAVWMSDNVTRVTGYPLESFIHEPGFWTSRIHPDDMAAVQTFLEEVAVGKVVKVEYRWRCADDEYHRFLDQVLTVPVTEENYQEYYGIWIDVTSIKHGENDRLVK